MHLSPGRTKPKAEHADFLPCSLEAELPRNNPCLWLELCYPLLWLRTLSWDCCTGTELVTSAEWKWALPSSELTVNDLFSCVFIQGCCSALGPLFWLLRDPTTQVHGNMINGCLAYASCYISPPYSAWDDRLGFPSPVCGPLNSSGYWFFNYISPQIVRIMFSL